MCLVVGIVIKIRKVKISKPLYRGLGSRGTIGIVTRVILFILIVLILLILLKRYYFICKN